MTLALVVGVTLLVLIVGVLLSSVSHKREQLAAERRQKAAEFRSRINETQDLLDGLQNAGVDASVRGALMRRMAENLAGLKECEPDYPNIDASINFFREQANQLRNQAGAVSPVVLPDNEQMLVAVLKRLRRLLQIYASMHQLGKVEPAEYAVQLPRLQHLLLKFEVEGYTRLGMLAMNMHQQGSAKIYFDFAHQRLIASALTDEYTQQQLNNLQELLDRLEPATEAATPEQKSEEAKPAVESDPAAFQPKKKW